MVGCIMYGGIAGMPLGLVSSSEMSLMCFYLQMSYTDQDDTGDSVGKNVSMPGS
jgi:hypothetical protein